jgi:two-component system chemotaxis sensor kinase CheA
MRNRWQHPEEHFAKDAGRFYMDDLLNEFLAETNESIERLDGDLVSLEQNPDDPELLSSIFRVLHTIKGTCGFLGLPRLQKLAHSGENVLGSFRDGTLTVTPAAMNPVLAALDRVKEIVAVLEQSGKGRGLYNPSVGRPKPTAAVA